MNATSPPLDDSRVLEAVREYQTALDAGQKPDRGAFQARFPDLSDALVRCLDALDFMHTVAPSLAADAAPLAAADLQPELPLGDFRLIREIGRGGMGVVYEAVQLSLGRRVALKVLPFTAALDGKQLQRFKNEAHAAAQLHHTNIVPIYYVGSERGVHFYAMQFIDGQSLAAVIAELRTQTERERNSAERASAVLSEAASALLTGPWAPGQKPVPDSWATAPGTVLPATILSVPPPTTPQAILSTEHAARSPAFFRTVAQLGAQAAEALEHAHHLGVIHRDVKPANLMVDGRGSLWMADFGLAHCLGDAALTMTGDLVGTLRYMSPEQALAKRVLIDHRTDIYSLGATLYELLALEPVFDGRDRQELLRQIAFEEPRPLRRLNKAIPAELETIVLKAMEKNPTDRYATAQELADDLERFLKDEPIRAKRPSLVQRARKWARRHKAVAWSATVATVLVLIVTVAVLATSMVLIAREKRATENALQREIGAKDVLRRDSYFHRIALAHRELSVNDLKHALELLGDCPEDLREWEWHYLKRLCRVEPVVLRDTTEVNSIAFSPDGEFLASAGGDGKVKVRSSKTGKVVQTLPAHTGFVSSVAFHPHGTHLASVGLDKQVKGADKQIKVWDLKTGLSVFSGPCDAVHLIGTAYAAAFSPDGRQLAAGSAGDVKVWDWKNHKLLHTFAGHDKHRISVAFSGDGRRLASGHWRGSVKLWDAEAGGEPLCTFPKTTPQPVVALAFSPDGGRLATASFDHRVDVWDTTTGELLRRLPHGALVLCVAFSPDGRRLASAGEDKTVRIWDAETGREVLSLRGHTGACGCVAFSPDGRRLASASLDETIRVWDATPLQRHEGQETLTLEYSDEIWSLAVSRDGQRIASAGWNMPAKVWDAHTGQGSVEFRGHRDLVFCVAWQPDGRRIASAGVDGQLFTVKVWDAQTGVEDFALPAHPGGPEFFAVAFSLDGRYLVTGSANRTVQVWDARTGQKVGTLGTHDREIRGVVFSRDGLHLASASSDGKVKLWDATRLKEEQEARHTISAWVPGQYLNVAFSPDGRRLATGGKENTVKIWDVQTGKELETLRGHTGDIYTVAFSPDGRWLASAGEDTTVRIWDATSWKPRHTLRGHTGPVRSLAFRISPDGRRLVVSGSRDHTVMVWDVTALEEVPDR